MNCILPSLVCLLSFSNIGVAQGTWTPLANLAPDYNSGVMLLLTDGTVLVKTSTGSSYGNTWDKLTPDSKGSYINGTWSTIAPMYDDRLYFSSQVLQDGRVYVAGGEYGSGGSAGEVYDPQTDTWTPTPLTGYYVGDAESKLLPDGKVFQAIVNTAGGEIYTEIWDPATNTYTAGPDCLRQNGEAAWVELPDSSILFIDNFGTTSERYIPSENIWVDDSIVPEELYDVVGEMGAGFLLPDGRAFFLGASGYTVYYTPSGTTSPGVWAAGPDIPDSLGTPDAASAMMPDGKILMAVSPIETGGTDIFPSPTTFYEFDYTTNTYTSLTAPDGTAYLNEASYFSNMLDLPDGTVLFASQSSNQYYEYTPDGTPLAAGKPVIDSIMQTSCTTFTITGKLFNGISQGAAYGDDWQMATNYPIIRITSGTTVYYARSYNWNRTGVMTGALRDTAQFTIPAGVTAGKYKLEVIANGIASDPHTFIPGPLAISPSSPSVCSGSSITLTDSTSGGVWKSTHAAVATIDSVTGVVTALSTGTATINYTLPHAACSTKVTLTVDLPPSAGTISGAASVCVGAAITLSDAATGGKWSSANGSAKVSGGTVTGVSAGTDSIRYSVTNSCATATAAKVITVNPLPNAGAISGTDSVCIGDTLSLTETAAGGTWSATNGNASVSSGGDVRGIVAGTDKITYTNTNGCGTASTSKTVRIVVCNVEVNNMAEPAQDITLYPNPAQNNIMITGTVPLRSIAISNLVGQVVFSGTYNANMVVVSLEKFPSGVYIAKINGTEVRKFVKE